MGDGVEVRVGSMATSPSSGTGEDLTGELDVTLC